MSREPFETMPDGCDGRKATCGSATDFQGGCIQPFEQPRFSNFADVNAEKKMTHTPAKK